MSLRPIKLPEDFQTAERLIVGSLEESNWPLYPSELDDVLSTIRFLRIFWKVIRVVRGVSQHLRDTLLGFVWEIDQKPIGMIVVDRRPRSTPWQITLVAILPPFRRRGIGTRLVNAAVNLIRNHGGDKIVVEMPGECVGTRRLFERMGFEVYDGLLEYDYALPEPPPAVPLPEGYVLSTLPYDAWRPRFELADRIMPPLLKSYEPIERHDFVRPRYVRIWRQLGLSMRSITETEFAMRTALEAQIVARGGFQIRSRWGEISEIALRVDSAHQVVAPYMLQFLLQNAQERSRRRRVEMVIPIWQPTLLELVEEVGFERQATYFKLGLTLQRVRR